MEAILIEFVYPVGVVRITARQDVFLLNVWRQQLPVGKRKKRQNFHENSSSKREISGVLTCLVLSRGGTYD